MIALVARRGAPGERPTWMCEWNFRGVSGGISICRDNLRLCIKDKFYNDTYRTTQHAQYNCNNKNNNKNSTGHWAISVTTDSVREAVARDRCHLTPLRLAHGHPTTSSPNCKAAPAQL